MHAKFQRHISSTSPSLVNVNVQKNPDPNARIVKGFLSCYTSVDEGSEKCSDNTAGETIQG
jgi:hypothetical protein